MVFVQWSDEEDEQLRQLARSGFGMVEIANLMQRTKSSVRVRALKLNIAIARQENPMRRGRLAASSRRNETRINTRLEVGPQARR
jgi:hypothetical protein